MRRIANTPLRFLGDRSEHLGTASGNQQKKHRREDVLACHKAAAETGASKSSKLPKVRCTNDGTKRCFLCGTTGGATNKIEASRVVQKQDVFAAKGEDALEVLDLLKGWASGCGWNRPLKIQDPMNLIWLCHKHNLAFDSHRFGLTLTGLDSGVCFCWCDGGCIQLVKSASERLLGDKEPLFDMSHVSQRAIGLRMLQAQKAGHFLNHSDPDAWETVVQLSAAASMVQNVAKSEEGDEW